MASPKDIPIVALGLCEHCNTLVSMLDMPADSMNAIWKCSCGGELSHLSFGYDHGGKGAKKVRWVGPELKWVTEQPINDFELGNIHVLVLTP